jgi:hypothetical protein
VFLTVKFEEVDNRQISRTILVNAMKRVYSMGGEVGGEVVREGIT